MSLNGKRIVIIGGASGIGNAVAQEAVAAGAQVVIASSNRSNVEAAALAIGPSAQAEQVDVTDEASVEALFARVGAFDHLIFSAGDWTEAMRGAPPAQVDLQAARGLFDVRFWGAITVVKHGHQGIREGGSITLTGGTVAHRPTPGAAINSAMAGAVEHAARALAIDLAPIRVNVVCPGLIHTAIWDMLMGEHREEAFRGITARQPLARAGAPKEIAQAYLYAMQAGFTTGQVITADGGATIV